MNQDYYTETPAHLYEITFHLKEPYKDNTTSTTIEIYNCSFYDDELNLIETTIENETLYFTE